MKSLLLPSTSPSIFSTRLSFLFLFLLSTSSLSLWTFLLWDLSLKPACWAEASPLVSSSRVSTAAGAGAQAAARRDDTTTNNNKGKDQNQNKKLSKRQIEPICQPFPLPPYIDLRTSTPNYPPGTLPADFLPHFPFAPNAITNFCIYHSECDCVGRRAGEGLNNCEFLNGGQQEGGGGQQQGQQQGQGGLQGLVRVQAMCLDTTICSCEEMVTIEEEGEGEGVGEGEEGEGEEAGIAAFLGVGTEASSTSESGSGSGSGSGDGDGDGMDGPIWVHGVDSSLVVGNGHGNGNANGNEHPSNDTASNPSGNGNPPLTNGDLHP
ncbi:Extracellular matrix protein fras1 [Lignoscripta atroalba]|nr:Extracellular matrix protein fras1 [Lignoscripta atroalba]